MHFWINFFFHIERVKSGATRSSHSTIQFRRLALRIALISGESSRRQKIGTKNVSLCGRGKKASLLQTIYNCSKYKFQAILRRFFYISFINSLISSRRGIPLRAPILLHLMAEAAEAKRMQFCIFHPISKP